MQGTFNRYHLTGELAKKHSHSTYQASPTNEPERQVILMVFASSLFPFPHERENLLLKAQHIKELQHQHLVPIMDMGIEEEQPFVVREYLPSGSLRSRLKKISPHRLELREALTVVSQVGQALAYAHRHHILHGNIKPENILFDASGQAILADFNLLSRNDTIIRDQISEEYAFCYMAPEQFEGTCDTKSDQYALGCLTYELITGQVPFATQSFASMKGQHSNALAAPLSKRVADLPPPLEAAVLKTLAKDPTERFFDFSLFLDVIGSVLSPPPTFPLARSVRPRKNKAVSHSEQSTQAENVISPIRERAARRTASQASKASDAFFSAKVEIGKPVIAASVPDANMPEQLGSTLIPELLESGSEVDLLASPSLENAYLEQETDISPVSAPANSIYGQSELEADRVAATLTGTIGMPGLQTVGLMRGKRRLGLMLLLLVIMAPVIYAFWPLGMSTSDSDSPIPQKLAEVVVPQVKIVSRAQPSAPVTATPTTQPSAQAKNALIERSPSQTFTKVLPTSPAQGSTLPAPESPPSPPKVPIRTIDASITFAGWTDNSPPGAGIAYPQIHSSAGGVGTYSDPITFSASRDALSPGTIIYVPYLKKYFIMEDYCDTCDSAWKQNRSYAITLWIGGDKNSSSSAQQSCENSLTPASKMSVEVQPPSDHAVDTRPLFTNSGGCIKL